MDKLCSTALQPALAYKERSSRFLFAPFFDIRVERHADSFGNQRKYFRLGVRVEGDYRDAFFTRLCDDPGHRIGIHRCNR
jgi:hypothetical protein